MSQHLQRAWMLAETSRWQQAEQEVRLALADDPDDAPAQALLGLCLVEQQQYEAATQAVQQAVSLAPDSAYSHYALARVWRERNRFEEAAKAIEEALRLDPWEVSHYDELARIRIHQERWNDAVAAAEQGLQIDPENNGCTNLKAMALVKLGQRATATEAIDDALNRDPEDAFTHANQGWTFLERGQSQEALTHFQESLRLDPTCDWARRGMAEALKARYFFYRWMLAFFFWMERMPSEIRWGVVLGAYFGAQLLWRLGRDNPALAPYLNVIVYLYVGFAICTWLSSPLSDLFLRMNRYGRGLLNREQVIASTVVGGLLAGGLISLCLALFSGEARTMFLWLALVLTLTIPCVNGVKNCEPGWPRKAMLAATCTVLGFGLVSFALDAFEYLSFGRLRVGPLHGLNVVFTIAFFVCAIGSQLAANYLMTVTVKR